jgi:protein gp37
MTAIQWTDEVWNPVTGCSRVSEGCRYCYIERTPPFRMQGRKLGDPVQLHRDRLYQPLKWKKPRRVFVNSLSDLFHDDVRTDFIQEVFAVMAICSQHTFQILTKRPQRMFDIVSSWGADDLYTYWHAFSGQPREAQGWPLPNVWLGVSVEDQQAADERIPLLLQMPAAVRWVSAEPLLAPVDLCRGGFSFLERVKSPSGTQHERIDWVVVGGESGPDARACDVAWIRSLVRQCRAPGVPCFVKQLGSYVVDRNDAGFDGDGDDWPMGTDIDDPSNDWSYQGARIRVRLHDRKGGDPEEWPKDLHVRRWPKELVR